MNLRHCNEMDTSMYYLGDPLSQTTINELPDDAMKEIFSRLSSDDLLGPVALVSKRWYHLTKDKTSWRRIDLSYPQDGDNYCRVVRLAPALRSVTLQNSGQYLVVNGRQWEVRGEKITVEVAVEALLMGVEDVKVLRINLESWETKFYELILRLLLKFTPCLKRLDLQVFRNRSILVKGETVNALGIVANMPQLRYLLLRDGMNDTDYEGELSTGLPMLNHFVYVSKRLPNKQTGPSPLLLDVIKNKKEQLTHLSVNGNTRPKSRRFHKDLEEVMSLCRQLRSVNLRGALSIWLINDLHHLEKIVYSMDMYMTEEEAITVENAFKSSRAMERLRELHLKAFWTERKEFVEFDNFPDYKVNRVLRSVSKHCKNLRILTLDGNMWLDGCITEILASLPLLERFEISSSGMKVHHLLQLLQMPYLKYVVISDFKLHDEEKVYARSLIQTMKQQKPDLVIRGAPSLFDGPEVQQKVRRDEVDIVALL